jgi:hypothetical protein
MIVGIREKLLFRMAVCKTYVMPTFTYNRKSWYPVRNFLDSQSFNLSLVTVRIMKVSSKSFSLSGVNLRQVDLIPKFE